MMASLLIASSSAHCSSVGLEGLAPIGSARFLERARRSRAKCLCFWSSQSVSQLFHGPAPRSPLHRLLVRLRRSRSNTSTEYSLPGATQLSQVRSISPCQRTRCSQVKSSQVYRVTSQVQEKKITSTSTTTRRPLSLSHVLLTGERAHTSMIRQQRKTSCKKPLLTALGSLHGHA